MAEVTSVVDPSTEDTTDQSAVWDVSQFTEPTERELFAVSTYRAQTEFTSNESICCVWSTPENSSCKSHLRMFDHIPTRLCQFWCPHRRSVFEFRKCDRAVNMCGCVGTTSGTTATDRADIRHSPFHTAALTGDALIPFAVSVHVTIGIVSDLNTEIFVSFVSRWYRFTGQSERRQ